MDIQTFTEEYGAKAMALQMHLNYRWNAILANLESKGLKLSENQKSAEKDFFASKEWEQYIGFMIMPTLVSHMAPMLHATLGKADTEPLFPFERLLQE